MFNMTKIIGTIGPSSSSKSMLKKLIYAGMDVARLNFSHGTHEEHALVIANIRQLSEQLKKPIAIMGDLQGPKIRTGMLKDAKGVTLVRNKFVSITIRNIKGTAECFSTGYRNLVKDVSTGDTLLIDDGLIELVVVSKTNDSVRCRIITGGILKEHKGINLPGIAVSAASLTPKDKKDLFFGIARGIDYFALSFVRSAQDLKVIKQLLKKHHSDIPVIAKIEKPEAVDNIDEILKIADGVMVARGDLGVELRPQQVPTIQKQIIMKAMNANKPVITATQMLDSMCNNPIPTRAEASDVANAIFDGTDAIMLSAETASGKYPVKAVQMMAKIAYETENSPFMRYNIHFEKDPSDLIRHAVAQSSVKILHEVDAKAIWSFSLSGKTSKLISKQRPSRPIYTFSPVKALYFRLGLVWGIIPVYIDPCDDAKKLILKGERILLKMRHTRRDTLVIIVTGLAQKSGSTNLIKLHHVGQED